MRAALLLVPAILLTLACGKVQPLPVKAVSELFMPVAGEVLEVNGRLDGEPALINNDPYGDGWMIKVRMAAGGDADLMSADAYKAQLGE